MLTYIVRRLLIGCVTLVLITFLIYALIRNMPGSPVTVAMGEVDPSKQLSKSDYERLTKHYGLDLPVYVGYFKWAKNVLRFDLDNSIPQKRPVIRLIKDALPNTLLLTVPSLILAYLVAIPMGLRATVKSGTLEERATSVVLYILYSLPVLVAALFLQIIVAVRLGWLPLMAMQSDNYDNLSEAGKAWDIFRHAVLPVICLTYGGLAYDSRFIKANMEEVIRQDYIRTARAKGVPPYRVVIHHAFRNTLIPLVTILGLSLPGLLSGAIILEHIFTWPGMGTLLFDAIGGRDYPTIMGVTLVLSVVTLAAQLLTDILYAVVDPRISYS